MTQAEKNHCQSAALLWASRQLVEKAFEIWPHKKFLILEVDVSLTADVKTISDYVASQNSAIESLKAQVTALTATQLTPDDQTGITAAAALAAQVQAAQATPAPPAA